MNSKSWMIYGANGYTGNLIVEAACHAGHKPVLAGRNATAIRALAEKWGLSWCTFDLNDPSAVRENLSKVQLVLNCAGPFSSTMRPLVAACLELGKHYLDITGEIEVFEYIHQRNKEAQQAHSVLIPGVGFDVVPSDCLAAKLSERLPDATHLELAFAGSQKVSPGTLKTMIENLPNGGRIRESGKIVAVPTAYRSKEIPFSHRTLWTSSIPWGDVSTAYYSTGIGNIVVYTAMSKWMSRLGKWTKFLSPLLSKRAVIQYLQKQVARHVKGPSEDDLKKGKTFLWGKVTNASGSSVEALLDAPEGYFLTVQSALACVERVLEGKVPPGAWTPSKAFGANFIDELPGTSFRYREANEPSFRR